MANLNLNKAILGGRLTATPELKQTTNGTSVTNFSIAINRKVKDAPTDFINCIAFSKTAELVCKYFKKGSSICVVGEIQVRSWTDKKGEKRYSTEVIVNEVNFVDSKAEAENAGQYVPGAYTTPAEPQFQEIDPDEDLPF